MHPGHSLTPFCLAMTKIDRSCFLLFAVTLTVTCSLEIKEFESAAANPPASAECERGEKLDLSAVGAKLEFEVKNTLDVHSRYELSIDGNKGTQWEECTVSSVADEIDYWIVLQSTYAIDRITLQSRRKYGNGAEVFVGNFNAAGKTENQQKCGDSYPEGHHYSLPPLTEFHCHGTQWVQYIRIRRVAKSLSNAPLQICEVEAYRSAYKYDLKGLNPQMFFEVNSLGRGSSYSLATDGIFDINNCSRSSSIRQNGSIWMKVDLGKVYPVFKVKILTPEPNLYRIFVSNSSEFRNITECNQNNFYEYICPGLQAQHVLVVYERPQDSLNRYYQMQVCEIEVYYKSAEEPRRYLPGLPCGFPPHLPKSTMTTDWKTANYTCDDNLIPQKQTIVCSSSGLWSSALQLCKPIECPNLHFPVHGSISLLKGYWERLPNTAVQSATKCMVMNGGNAYQKTMGFP